MLIFSCLAVAAVSQAIVLDPFTVPYQKGLRTGSWVDFQTDAGIFSGERDVRIRATRDFSEGSEGSVTIGDGRWIVSNGSGGRASVVLQYDGVGDEVGNTGAGRELVTGDPGLSPFPTGTSRVRFHVQRTEALSDFGVILYQNGIEQAALSRNAGAGVNFTVDVPLPPSLFARCDAIAVYAGISQSNASVVVTQVELVPEASGALSLIGGLFGLTLLRRRL